MPTIICPRCQTPGHIKEDPESIFYCDSCGQQVKVAVLYKVRLTVSMENTAPTSLNSEWIPAERARMRYDQLVRSLFHDPSGCYYQVDLIGLDAAHNEVIIETETL